MFMSSYSDIAISSANKYLNYLKKHGKGKSTIRVRKISVIDPQKYQFYLSQKAPYIDSLSLKLDPSLGPFHNIQANFKILSYDEKQLCLVVTVSGALDQILQHARANQITFESDLTFLVEAVLKWYDKYGNQLSFPDKPQIAVHDILHPDTGSLEQNAAIDSCLCSPLSYVWGAPGTGKTKLVLSSMIYQYIKQDRRVLVMAPTNNSLEQSLRGILEVLLEKGITPTKVIRLGRPTKEFAEEYPEACEASHLDDVMHSIAEELQKLKQQKDFQARYFKIIAYQEEASPLLSPYSEMQNHINSTEQQLVSLHTQLTSAYKNQSSRKEAKNSAQKDLQYYRQYRGKQQRYLTLTEQFRQYDAIVSQHLTKVRKLTSDLKALRDEQSSVNIAIEKLTNNLETARKNHQELIRQTEKIWNRTVLAFSKKKRQNMAHSIDTLSSMVQTLQTELQDSRSFADNLARRIQELNDQIARENVLYQTSPQLTEISKRTFDLSLSPDALNTRFQEELSHYSDFKCIDNLEEIISNKGALLHTADKLLTESDQAVSDLEEHVRALTSDLCQSKERLQLIDNHINRMSILAFDQEMPLEMFLHTCQEFLEAHSSFVPDPDLEQTIAEKTAAYDNILQNVKAVMEGRCVIACTVDYATLHYEQFTAGIGNSASHLFVDEAAYCSLIKAGIFFSLKLPITFLGDHMQLPPVCEMNKKDIISDPHSHDCFLWDMSAVYFPDLFLENIEISDMFDAYFKNREPKFENIQVSFLTKTFRFGKELAQVLDNFIYHRGFHGADSNQTSVTILDAPRMNRGLPFTQSPDEVQAIKWYLNTHQLDDYVILAPYKLQRNLLEDTLKLPSGKILTIHASQGREWDTVIVSVTDAYRKFFMSSARADSPGIRIVNTAVSRTRKHLILVMDYHAWKQDKNFSKELIANIAETNSEYINSI